MILNSRVPDRSRLKVLILSCPKTGNTWLRWLMHHAYLIPVVDLPPEWSDEHARRLPDAFVTHQHLWPTPPLVRWLVDNDAAVFTTIRHPGDTLLSYFHYARWQDLSASKAVAALEKDGGRPGTHALKFAKFVFAQAYSLSLAWARLGAHVVRYEDLLEDPVRQLRIHTSRIAPLDEDTLKAAALLCKPEYLTRPGIVDPRHLRTTTSGQWARELPAEIVTALSSMQPFRAACEAHGYDWNRATPPPVRFDYVSIDPFRGQAQFDNGEPVGPTMPKIYLHEAPGASTRWPDPIRTEGDSFWNWLRSPHERSALNPDVAPMTFTNLMAVLHRMRPDVRAAYPDPVSADRLGFLGWFIGQAVNEFELAWGLVAPVLDSYCDHLEASARRSASEAPTTSGTGGDPS